MAEKKVDLRAIKQISPYEYEIEKTYRSDMRVPARIFINQKMLEKTQDELSLWQLINVATLPGVQRAVFAMPDIHQGYGFPIGGVAATAIHEGGVISPGGIGYDINCGVRLLATNLKKTDIERYKTELASELFAAVPSGVGASGNIQLSDKDMDALLKNGANHALSLGFGHDDDIIFCESEGRMENADPALVSEYAKKRALDQLGTLGSGNHFLEVQSVDDIFDERIAHIFSLERDMVTIMIHCGSRGLGHQTCTDYVKIMNKTYDPKKLSLPDRELIYAPFFSPEGQHYFNAMAAAANFAFANRHTIGHQVRKVFQKIFGTSVEVKTVYDLSHNIGKREKHPIDGIEKELLLHRKGATRAFAKDHPENPEKYRTTGHPVLIPGTMGTASYVLVGSEENNAFYSSCHGAGRVLSRMSAKRSFRGSDLKKQLEKQGIVIRSESNVGLAEEAPHAYKDIEEVIQIVVGAHLARPIARLVPLVVVKG